MKRSDLGRALNLNEEIEKRKNEIKMLQEGYKPHSRIALNLVMDLGELGESQEQITKYLTTSEIEYLIKNREEEIVFLEKELEGIL